MILNTNSKQFAEAHEWALKAIQADATDKGAYYTAAFVDWAMTYPDYAQARQAAGMKPQDPGIIPDASLRQNVRTQHGAQTRRRLPHAADRAATRPRLFRCHGLHEPARTASRPASRTPRRNTPNFIAKADSWVRKALAAKRKQAQNPPQPPGALNVDGAVPEPSAPPPPPPPPPPPAANGQAVVLPPGAIRIEGNIQQAKLVSQAPPIYPPLARQARISGMVRLSVTIAADGTVRNIQVLSGHPLLVPAAIDAVRKWVYEKTLLNGAASGSSDTGECHVQRQRSIEARTGHSGQGVTFRLTEPTPPSSTWTWTARGASARTNAGSVRASNSTRSKAKA